MGAQRRTKTRSAEDKSRIRTIMLKLTVAWLVIIVCGTMWLVTQLDKEDKECIETCSALGKEAVFKEQAGHGSKIRRLSTCRCAE